VRTPFNVAVPIYDTPNWPLLSQRFFVIRSVVSFAVAYDLIVKIVSLVT
jgi:hypothetical protein